MSLKKLLAILAVSLFAFGAQAEDMVEDHLKDRLYLGLGGVLAFENYDGNLGNADSTAGGVDARIGYRMSPIFSLEFEYLGYYSENVGTRSVDSHNYTINGKFNLSGNMFNHGKISGLVKAGYMNNIITNGPDEGGFVGAVGLMFSYYFNNNIGLTFEADYYIGTGDVSDYDFIPLTFGLEYRF